MGTGFLIMECPFNNEHLFLLLRTEYYYTGNALKKREIENRFVTTHARSEDLLLSRNLLKHSRDLLVLKMGFITSIFKGKARQGPEQGIGSKEKQEEVLSESREVPCPEVQQTKVDETESIETESIEIEDKKESDRASDVEDVIPNLENFYADPIPEYQPTVLLPSPEACQIRTLMKGFDSKVRERYEARCNVNAHAGSMLVELLEQYKVFEESALISHGQQHNMLGLVEYTKNCIKNYIPSGEEDENEEEFEKLIKRVIKCLQSLGSIARSYAEPGWVYRLAIDSSLTDRMNRMALEMEEAFRRLGSTHNEKPKIENMHKFLLDNVKSYGDGSWSAGLVALRNNPGALEVLATHLEISRSAMIIESYLNMNLPWALRTLSAKDARKDESRTVFQEYCDSIGQDGSMSLLSSSGFEKYWMDSSSSDAHGVTKGIEEASKLFVKLDSDFDGLLDADDFESHYLQKGVTTARSLIRRICGVSGERRMRHTFDSFAMFGMGSHSVAPKMLSLDCARFAKLCRDSNMICKPNHVKELDIVFSKCVPRNCKKMDFEHFLASISRMSVAIGLSMSEICKRIMTSAGPTSRCTKSSFVKLHDDRSLFTGIYARGGPDVGPVTVDMKAFVGRVKPKEKKSTASESLEVTLPESPTMATASRVTSPGPRTPGRGASLEACEMRKSRELKDSSATSKGKKGKKSRPSVAFGRGTERRGNAKATEVVEPSPKTIGDSVTKQCIAISATISEGHGD